MHERMNRAAAPKQGSGAARDGRTSEAVPEVPMSEAERIVLSALIARFGVRVFTAEEVARLPVPLRSEAAKQAAFLMLRRKGVVTTMKKMWGERVFAVPRRAFPALCSLALGAFPWREEAPADVRPEPEEPHRPLGLSLSILRLLQWVEEEACALTKQGTLPGKAVERAASRLVLREEALAGLPLVQRRPASYPKAFAVVLDAAFRLGLLAVSRNLLQLDPARADAWLDAPADEREGELIDLWHAVHLPEPVWLQLAAQAIRGLPPGVWIGLDAFLAWLMRLEPEGMPARADEAAAVLRERWLRPLAACGWLALGRSGDRAAFCLQAPEPEREDGVVVLDDYEILVPPDVPFRLRRLLEAFGETVAADEVTRLRLTRAGVRRALEAGHDPEAFLSRLAKASADGVPDHLRRTLREWRDQVMGVRLARVCLLRVSDPDTAEALASRSDLAPYFAERIGPYAFIVAHGSQEALRGRLERIGYAPIQAEDREPDGGREDALRRPDGIVQPAVPEPVYELDREEPAWTALYPDLDRLPQMWLNELRTYHESTCKQLIRKAVEYRAGVRIRRCGRTAEVAALGLEEDRHGWSFQGLLEGSEIRLGPGDWQEIQLILPGINDKTELIPHP